MGNIMGKTEGNDEDMNDVRIKMYDNEILDSEIIKNIENIKKKHTNIDINCINSNHYTYLMDAIRYNRIELVKYLLTYSGTKVNQMADCGAAALHMCSDKNQYPMLCLLLTREDLKVNVRDCYGQTVLHRACSLGNEEGVLELLLDGRIDPLIRNKSGNTALDIATECKKNKIVDIMKKFFISE